jgi:hypothetical protein
MSIVKVAAAKWRAHVKNILKKPTKSLNEEDVRLLNLIKDRRNIGNDKIYQTQRKMRDLTYNSENSKNIHNRILDMSKKNTDSRFGNDWNTQEHINRPKRLERGAFYKRMKKYDFDHDMFNKNFTKPNVNSSNKILKIGLGIAGGLAAAGGIGYGIHRYNKKSK